MFLGFLACAAAEPVEELRQMVSAQQQIIEEQGQAIAELQQSMTHRAPVRQTMFGLAPDELPCSSPTSLPPDVFGYFYSDATPLILVHNTTTLGDLGVGRGAMSFKKTEPADPMFAVFRDHEPCDSSKFEGCVGGFVEDLNERQACTWFWGCTWSLYCVDNEDTGLYLFTPLAMSANKVQKIRKMYIETGPRYLLDNGAPNRKHTALVAQVLYSRVPDLSDIFPRE